ncbi:MAG: hypothetical protein RL660_27 [Bacteroidota bacterium]|jgi:hypothetical protein
MLIEVSNGEIVDKFCILQIKLEHIQDEAKRQNVQLEYDTLKPMVAKILSSDHALFQQLLDTNRKLWQIEDQCRDHEKRQVFDETFIAIARSVYITNDERARIKKEINLLTNSQLVEEKSYQ